MSPLSTEGIPHPCFLTEFLASVPISVTHMGSSDISPVEVRLNVFLLLHDFAALPPVRLNASSGACYFVRPVQSKLESTVESNHLSGTRGDTLDVVEPDRKLGRA